MLQTAFGPFCMNRALVFEWDKRFKIIETLTQEDFHGAFQKLFERYNKCIAAGEGYFEGD